MTRPLVTYRDRLSSHIDSYLDAVLQAPGVRWAEFARLHEFARLDEPRRLLEVPAEGDMLERLYPGARIWRADFLKTGVAGYSDALTVTDWSLANLPQAFFDGVLAVVPFHHAAPTEKRTFLQGVWRTLRPGGVLCLGEVEAGSRVHRFLDGFVDAHTSTGHVGDYPDAGFAAELDASGFVGVATATLECPWVFDSPPEMVAYVRRLFALDDISDTELLDALQEALGWRAVDGRWELAWSLRYFRGVRPAANAPDARG